jgi:serine/threonine-protein kinase
MSLATLPVQTGKANKHTHSHKLVDSMIKKTAILLIGAVLIVSVLASGCTFNLGNTTTSPTSTTYTSSRGYSIAYPSDWGKPQEQNNGTLVVFLTPTNNETENLNVQVYNLSANSTLATVTESVKSNAENYDNFTQIEATNTTLAGLPAYKIVLKATADGDQLKALQTWTVKDGKAYIITYKGAPTNYDTHLSAAQKMIDSFQIK